MNFVATLFVVVVHSINDVTIGIIDRATIGMAHK